MRPIKASFATAVMAVAAVAAAAVSVSVSGSPASAQARAHAPAVEDVIVTQPFYARSGDACVMGFTKGTLGWHLGARWVDVTGIVADRPLPSDPNAICGDDGRYTTATFAAYARTGALASTAVRVDNDQRTFSVRLVTTVPIDVIVVQVCRAHPVPGPPLYCGPAQRYPAPLITPVT